jgi:hypothetical protein
MIMAIAWRVRSLSEPGSSVYLIIVAPVKMIAVPTTMPKATCNRGRRKVALPEEIQLLGDKDVRIEE